MSDVGVTTDASERHHMKILHLDSSAIAAKAAQADAISQAA
jgi:hypothetical protein